MYQTISITDHESIRVIALFRPDRRNALTQEMIGELTDAFSAAVNDDAVRVLILTGAGEAFCSGLDLSEMQKLTMQSPEEQREGTDRIATMMRTLYDCPKPTIAAVNGAAVAGGMGLATICDFTLAVRESRFGYPEVRIGFIPAIVSAFLLRQVGEKRAMDLLLTGRLIDATEAHGIGLVTRIVEEGSAVEAAMAFAAELLKSSPVSVQATKALLRAQGRAQLDRDLAAAAEANAEMRRTDDFAEGLAAFLEKRKPRWGKSG
jgi:methylglutaconyl-CoA hydratase